MYVSYIRTYLQVGDGGVGAFHEGVHFLLCSRKTGLFVVQLPLQESDAAGLLCHQGLQRADLQAGRHGCVA